MRTTQILLLVVVELCSARATTDCLGADIPDAEHKPSPQPLRRTGSSGIALQSRRVVWTDQRMRATGVYKAQITPHWFANNTRFWYRNDLPNGAKEFILVDAQSGTRQPAFDHNAVASQLGIGVDPKHLPIDELEFDPEDETVMLLSQSNKWKLNLKTGKLDPVTNATTHTSAEEQLVIQARPKPSVRTGQETTITFDNRLDTEVQIFWLDSDGARNSYGVIPPHSKRVQHTYGGHVWLVTDPKGETIAVFEATDTPAIAVISDRTVTQEHFAGLPVQRPSNRIRSGKSTVPSPNGKLIALIKDHNTYVRTAGGDEVQLSTNGVPTNYYDKLEWSPDSRYLIAWRVEPGDIKEVYLIRSSPPGGGRATFEARPYAQPGDKFPRYELNIFDLQTYKQTKPEVDRFEHEWEKPQLHWEKDGRHFTYWQVDRGHQRARLIEVDVATGTVRNVIDERSNTFIWTAHTENLQLNLVTWLTKTDEVIYVSERDGWRHLYLVDIKTGTMQQCTKGECVVRGIDLIDEDKRQIWFSASGRNPVQDPYFIHFYRVNFDGTGLVALTEGNGTHSVQYSPDRRFIIDTYSRVDMPPVHELRRASDGAFVCTLEQADATELFASGWTPPENFVAKGRDGKTDIWGIIWRPHNFDPNKKYPVVEHIYAGPQGAFVPKSFMAVVRPPSLTKLGFVVVQIDGMGTAHRSKAFHDVCWRNLKDAGFPDRILWHQAVAAKYPWYDITRVGIYGNSAGGQNAAAAVLFHPDFYKAAVAACGCHDNRLDKASWNEQWMGYMPADKIWLNTPDNWYAQNSNIEHAHLLRGKLLLIVGELDRNVPPESTMRFVDALIRAEKDFDLLVIPNGGHGIGGAYGERKMQDFFMRNLLGVEPPDRNAHTSTSAGER